MKKLTLIILILLFTSLTFGQSGKSVLSEAQKDSIGAMISDSLANFTSGLDTNAVEGIAGQVASDSIAQYTLSPTYQPSFIMGSGGLWKDYNTTDFLDSLGVVQNERHLTEIYTPSNSNRRLQFNMNDTAKVYTYTPSSGVYGNWSMWLRALDFKFYTSSDDSINGVNYNPLSLSVRGNILINGAADAVGTYGAMIFKNIAGDEPVGANGNSKLYNYGSYLKVRDGNGIAMTLYYRISQTTFNSAATDTLVFLSDFPTSLNEPDENYKVFVTGNVNETFWVTDKTSLGFVLHSSNASSTATVDIEVRR